MIQYTQSRNLATNMFLQTSIFDFFRKITKMFYFKQNVNPSEQPCQPSENPEHPSSLIWLNSITLDICFVLYSKDYQLSLTHFPIIFTIRYKLYLPIVLKIKILTFLSPNPNGVRNVLNTHPLGLLINLTIHQCTLKDYQFECQQVKHQLFKKK